MFNQKKVSKLEKVFFIILASVLFFPTFGYPLGKGFYYFFCREDYYNVISLLNYLRNNTLPEPKKWSLNAHTSIEKEIWEWEDVCFGEYNLIKWKNNNLSIHPADTSCVVIVTQSFISKKIFKEINRILNISILRRGNK